MAQFPEGAHDDQLDSIAQFLNWHEDRSRHVGGGRMVKLSGI